LTIPMPRLVILLSAVVVLSCRQTDRQTESHTHTEADDRYTHATTVGVTNDNAAVNTLFFLKEAVEHSGSK